MTRDDFEQALAEYERRLREKYDGFYTAGELQSLRATLVEIATRGAVPRKPTEAMIAAGHRRWMDFIHSWGSDPVQGTAAESVYIAMYDAALAQPSEPNSCPKCCRPDNEPCPRPYCWRAHDAALAQPSEAGKGEHPLSGLHINRGSVDAATDHYEQDYWAEQEQRKADGDAARGALQPVSYYVRDAIGRMQERIHTSPPAAPSAEDDAGLIAEIDDAVQGSYWWHEPYVKCAAVLLKCRARLSRPQEKP